MLNLANITFQFNLSEPNNCCVPLSGFVSIFCSPIIDFPVETSTCLVCSIAFILIRESYIGHAHERSNGSNHSVGAIFIRSMCNDKFKAIAKSAYFAGKSEVINNIK